MKEVRPGPKAATGNYQTEEELRKEVAKFRRAKKSYGQIAELCGISAGTAHNIVKSIIEEEEQGEEAQLKRRMMRMKW